MDIFNKKKIKDFIIYGFGQSINILGPILVLPFLIDKCGVENVGKIGVGMSVALILNGIIDYGSYINGVKEISINRHNNLSLQKSFNTIYLSKLLLFVIILFFFSVAILLFPYLNEDKYLFIFSFSIVIGQVINPAWFFQGVENFKLISIVNIVSKVIYILLIFIFISKRQDYVFANLFLGIGAIIANLFGLAWLIKIYSFTFKNAKISDALLILKEEFSFSLSQFFLSMYQFFPIVIISFIGGDLIAGQYRIIDQVVSIFKTYLNMFFYFVYSNICYEFDKNYNKGLSVWKQYNGSNLLLILIFLIPFSLFATPILNFFKINLIQFFEIKDNFRLALLIPFLIAISLPLRQLMFVFDLNKIYIKITITVTILNFILLFFLTKYAGLTGSFISIIFIEFIIIVLYIYILKVNLKAKKITK
jgi:O-antigen/teichoic acid export membrane protein